MGSWDNVEKSKKPVSNDDIFWEYVKLGFYLIAGMAFAYFIILGTTI